MNSQPEKVIVVPPNRTRVQDALYRCPECFDCGWVETINPESGLPPAAHPCRHCRVIAYRRWHEGHYAMDHHCPECSALRTGQVTTMEYDNEGQWIGRP